MQHALTQQTGRGQHGEQESHALHQAGQQQHSRPRCQCAECAAQRQQHQPGQHHAPRTQPIRRQADRQAEGHAGKLHEGQQKAGLHQGQTQGFAQHGNGHRQFAHMQCTGDTHRKHNGGRSPRSRIVSGSHSAAPWTQGKTTAPNKRSCSRMAKRSVMPAM